METEQDEMNLDEQWWEVFCFNHTLIKISSTILVQYCIVAHKPCLNLRNRIEYIFINWSRLSEYSVLAPSIIASHMV